MQNTEFSYSRPIETFDILSAFEQILLIEYAKGFLRGPNERHIDEKEIDRFSMMADGGVLADVDDDFLYDADIHNSEYMKANAYQEVEPESYYDHNCDVRKNHLHLDGIVFDIFVLKHHGEELAEKIRVAISRWVYSIGFDEFAINRKTGVITANIDGCEVPYFFG